ncbi:MAG: matrixin family metalloprotease [Thermoanaerobaculia bacterium]|nr:matrixin family metalloprotease [Thermoanaerobaculia bacterium]
MRKIRSSRILLAAAVVSFLATSLFAYALLNPRRVWRETPVTYIVDDRGQASIDEPDHGLSATINAINSQDAWNGAGAGDVVNAVAGDISGFQLGDNIPMLNFTDPTGQCSGNCLAATFTGFYSRRGRNVFIDDADIVTNTAYDWTSESETGGCSGEFFIEGVQVHEIGHGLGLGHTNVTGATMYPSVSSCNNGPATTEADDEAGICDLYGCGGGGCDLGQKGDSCSADNQCCSGKCRGGACR